MKFILPLLFLTGCGTCSRMKAGYTGYDIICVDEIKYIQFTSGATVKYDVNGKPEVCK